MWFTPQWKPEFSNVVEFSNAARCVVPARGGRHTPCLMPRPQVVKVKVKLNEMLTSSLFLMTIYAHVGCADVTSLVA